MSSLALHDIVWDMHNHMVFGNVGDGKYFHQIFVLWFETVIQPLTLDHPHDFVMLLNLNYQHDLVT